MKTKNKGTLLIKLIKLIYKLVKFFKNKSDKKDEAQKLIAIENAKNELKKALAEGRISDAVYWREKLMQISRVVLLLFLFGAYGCATKPEQQVVVVIGERIIKVNEGDTIKVPPLISPAKQWYLVDDAGLYQWLDIDLSKK